MCKHLSDTFPILTGLEKGDAFITILLVLEHAIRRSKITRKDW
jgi:hypothetical protein